MELMANLDTSRISQGLTPDNLEYLEKVYQDTVGDKQEIDLNHFKKIVQSKNMFFVERIFHVFDADNSGSVSREEFMRVMRCFAEQSPSEKLRILFDVYDLNNDGTIQFSELRNVISECMKENGLKFEECEIDELTKMLFEDADTDGSGTITFNEFKNQLERHPAFMQNLTLSIERWLIPPMKPPRYSEFVKFLTHRNLIWQRIRNNWTSVMYLFVYFIINLTLFISRAYEYRQSNGYVICARACGQCLNFNCAFVVVLVLRQTLTWLRTHGFSQYFPIDQHLYYHKLTGYVIVFYSYLHTFMHLGNFAILSQEKNSMSEYLFTTNMGIGWVGGSACITGWILLAVLTVMAISAMPFVRRSGKFEVFYCLHMLSFLFWICLVLHGPSFWKWFLAPAVLFLVEIAVRINRNLSSSKKAYVQQGVLLPSKVTHLVIKRPPKFDYRPGDYVYINIPAIAKYEWHPFTVSSAPELDDVIWLHIRGVGEWTNSLYSFFEREDKEAILSDELVDTINLNRSIKSSKEDDSSVAVECSVDAGFLKPSSAGNLRHSSRSCPDTTFSYCSPCYVTEEQRIVNGDNSMSNLFDTSKETIVPVDKLDNVTMTPNVSQGSSLSSRSSSARFPHRRTSFSSTSTSRAIMLKNKSDIKAIFAEQNNKTSVFLEVPFSTHGRTSPSKFPKEKRKSVRVSVAKKGLRRCQTVIVMPAVIEDDEDEETKNDLENENLKTEEEVKDLKREVEVENVVLTQKTLKIFIDGPYGSPTRHIFQARHAVLIATGIGVTPFASILQSIMYQYRKSRHTCPKCNHKWSDPMPVSSVHLKKVDFFWLNRHQKSFEWFVNLLSELEVEQAQLREKDRFLDIHMYITSALNSSDMKAVGLQMALDLLYQKEKRCLITGLKSRTQPGRPNWNEVFQTIAQQRKGKVTVFFCGPDQLAKTLQTKCDEFKFRFRKEIF
ncbi:NADPH oxidase 5-like [Uloborus diversus]|uniref:NADPH oxidase 5-like n=1 Tax=Uloborus diversus TaxID=327109 RepID=UPI0024092A87|nr:NADPH oxidase 5-like [Uloborus diversus]